MDPDAALMVEFQNGNNDAFEQLLDKYDKLIVNFIYKIVNDRGRAEELAQEVFLRVYRARGRYEPRARFAAWIYRIAANLSLKAAAREGRMPRYEPKQERDGGGGSERFEPSDPRPDAENQLIGSENAALVQRAVQSLPKKERIAVILRRFENLSYKEISVAMNCTEAAVKTYIHRGKLHLKAKLMPHHQGRT